MSTSASQRLSKPLKLLVSLGLLILVALWIAKNNLKFLPVLLSKYRALLPYIIAQAKHESENFGSKVYRTDNNLFGMKMTTKRPTTSNVQGLKAEGGSWYKHYGSPMESVRDLLLWMDYTNFPVSVADATTYAAQLKQRAYFTDAIENYTTALQRHLA